MVYVEKHIIDGFAYAYVWAKTNYGVHYLLKIENWNEAA